MTKTSLDEQTNTSVVQQQYIYKSVAYFPWMYIGSEVPTLFSMLNWCNAKSQSVIFKTDFVVTQKRPGSKVTKKT